MKIEDSYTLSDLLYLNLCPWYSLSLLYMTNNTLRENMRGVKVKKYNDQEISPFPLGNWSKWNKIN